MGLAPITKYLDDIFPDPDDPEVSILLDQCQDHFMFGFVVNMSSFLFLLLVCVNYKLITAYLLLRVNLDKIMHAR